MAEEQEAQLICRMRMGDLAAVEQIYDQYASDMFLAAVRVLNDSGDAEDLVHDVFLEAWDNAAGYDPHRGSVRTWLLMRVRCRAIDRIRSRSLPRKHALRELASAALRTTDFEDPGRHCDRDRLLRALLCLPQDQRSVIESRYLEGLSAREIAELHQVPEGTVKSRLAAGLSKLRRTLATQERER